MENRCVSGFPGEEMLVGIGACQMFEVSLPQISRISADDLHETEHPAPDIRHPSSAPPCFLSKNAYFQAYNNPCHQ